jgi:hypothetical protein
METNEQLLKRAREAEEMAAVVSYARDKERLLRQAEELRRQAEQAASQPRP